MSEENSERQRIISPELEGPLFLKYGIELEGSKTLFKENEIGREMFILLSGKMSIRQQLANGDVQELALLDGDQFDETAAQSSSRIIGEMSILENRPRSATAMATTRCKLIRIDEPTFYSMLRYNAQFALEFMRVLSYRLRAANENRQEMGSEVARLRRRLIRLNTAALVGRKTIGKEKPASLKSILSEALAEEDGLTADLVAEGISWLKEREYVAIEDGKVKILDRRFFEISLDLAGDV